MNTRKLGPNQKFNLKMWLLAFRPKTLTTALIPVVVGTAASYAIHGKVRLGLSLLALMCSFAIQIGTNLINDAMDFKKGADTQERIGPKRITQSGEASFRQVWWAGISFFLLAMIFAIPLLLEGGLPILLMGCFSLLAGYAYTGGPFPLAYLGLGDLFVLVFFGWVAVGGVYLLNSGFVDIPAVVAGAQVGLLATVLIAINNFRDSITDKKAKKKTLAVRFGPTFARVEIATLSAVPFFIGLFWFYEGFRWAAFLPFLMFPLALKLVQNVHSTEPGPIYNRFLAQGALLHLGFGILFGIGLFLK
jgi:1,4-dihydroxy-2-naphthoate octaprenyltransferase